ncbi:hypothetical protein FS837_006407 [Tulasnella sp. UAMH 9824]|nr:hypothetical protein FS837_006407 [Tulasnella sp. UAMH 9824]
MSVHFHETFWKAFKAHLDERHVVLERPEIGGKEIELNQLFLIVGALGGHRAVREKQLWPVVEAKLGLLDLDEAKASQSRPALTEQLSTIYQNTLADFETHWYNSLHPSDPGSAFPLPPQLQFLHPEIQNLVNTTTHMSSELDGPLHSEPQHETTAAVRSRCLTAQVGPENPGLTTLPSLGEDATKIEVTPPTNPYIRTLDDKTKPIVERALDILGNRPIPAFEKHLPRKERSEAQALSAGKYDARDVEALLREAEELRFDSSEMRDLRGLEMWAAGWAQRASAMIAILDRAGPNAPLDRAAWDALFSEAYSHNYRLRLFEDVGRVVKRVRLLEELRATQDIPLTMEDVEELQKQALSCSLPSENEEFVKLRELAERGTQWYKDAQMVLDTSIVTLEDLNKLATPSYPVPIFPQLLERIESLRGHACEIEKQAKAILSPSVGSRTPISEALRLVSTTPNCFLIPAVQILAEVAPQAARIEKTCFDIINDQYSPGSLCQSPVEELREMRNTVQEKLPMFAIPSFDIAYQQLAQHDAWLEKLPWHRTGEPAIQGKLIADEVVQNTQPRDDAPPSDPECTCICLLPVKVTSRRQADAVKCYDCGAKFHSECVEGSCPFCDHHHWNGALPKARSFEFTDLLHLESTVPNLTRNHSLVWKHMEVIITSVDRLTGSITAFLSKTTASSPPTVIPQIRHFLRKLYKIHFRIRARADSPPYGLTLCYLYRSLANKKRTRDVAQPRRPYFIFTAEFMHLASDGSRCICKGSRGGHHLITCKSCSFKFHGNCVIYDDASNPCPEHWRCPMCTTRKGKRYPQSAVRVRATTERDMNVYIDTKACLDNYSSQLIRQRLPPPINYTIILELERFIPGGNQSTDSSLTTWRRPLIRQPYADPSSHTLQGRSRTFNTASPSTPGSTSTSPPASPTSSAGSFSLSLRMAGPAPPYITTIATKRKVPASPTLENPRRTKSIVRESGALIHDEISQEEYLFM